VSGDLVLRRDLPRQPDVVAETPLRLGPGPRQIRREHERRLIRLIESIRPHLLVAPEPVRRPEPDPVSLQRTANRKARVPDSVDAVGGRDALRPHRIVDVVPLEVVVREVAERGSAESVAAFLRNNVDAHSAAAYFRRDGAELVAELLRG